MTARPRQFKLASPLQHEWSLQVQITDLLRLELAPPGRVSRAGVVWWSIDIAGYGGEVPGARIARGVIAGCPDIFVLHLGLAHFIELKSADGEMSDAQRSIAAAILGAQGRFGVATKAEQVLACLDRWKIPRARRTPIEAVTA